MTNFEAGIKALILDMDGVLWRGPEPIGNLPEIFSRLAHNGVRVVLATNNSTRTVMQYVRRVREFGVDLQPWQIVTSAQATVDMLLEHYPGKGTVFVVGEQSLSNTLEEAGFAVGELNVVAVVAGMDRGFSYEKLRKATLLIRSGALFIGTNPDLTFPTPDGLVPGAGAILAAIQAAAHTEPVIAGKPSPRMYQIALQRLSTKPEETLVVGDRLETDIAGGQRLGCPTALVLSGVVDRTIAEAWRPAPNIIAADLAEVVELLGS